jgi:F-type H+-transporting ATPase subunit a
MVSVIIWSNNIKHKGVGGWLKGFAEPIVVMTPMNVISEIAQPISMAFRHFGNVAGGGVVTAILYVAFSLVSNLVLGLITSIGWVMCAALLALAVYVFLKGKGKLMSQFLAVILALLGVFGLLEAFGLLSGVPVLAFGVPAVLSLYFDIFSGFVQALVFTLLSMVYIAGSLPGPEEHVGK